MRFLLNTVIYCSLLIIASVAIAKESNADTGGALSDGVWSGVMRGWNHNQCNFTTRPAMGQMRNGVFTVRVSDGWDVERRFISLVDEEGNFSGVSNWPKMAVGWSTQAVNDEGTLQGKFDAKSFRADVGPTHGGRGCVGTVIMLPGADNGRMAWENLEEKCHHGGGHAHGTVSLFDSSVIDQETGELIHRLAKIKKLVEDGLISEEEAAAKRKALLEAF